MRRIKITLDYIGTSYSGWQRQPGQDTVQQRVEDALEALTGIKTSVTASGRTDAGVHALGQVAHFDTDSVLPVKNFMTGLNHFLPADIRVLSAMQAEDGFHARFSAKEKTYCYCLYESPFDRAVYLNRAVRVAERTEYRRHAQRGGGVYRRARLYLVYVGGRGYENVRAHGKIAENRSQRRSGENLRDGKRFSLQYGAAYSRRFGARGRRSNR